MLLLLCAVGRAAAADGFDAHGFAFVGLEANPVSPLTVVRYSQGVPLALDLAGTFEFARAPLVQYTRTADGVSSTPVLDNLLALDLAAGFSPLRPLRIEATLPLYLTSTGADGASQGFSVGDARLAALVTVIRPDPTAKVGFGLAVRPHLDVPLGVAESWLGQGMVAGGGVVAGALDIGRIALSVDTGLQFNPETSIVNLTNSDRLLLGAAVGYRFSDRIGATLETHSSFAFDANAVPGADSPSELLLSGRYVAASGAHGLVGASVGLSDGAGAATWRLFVGGGFGVQPTPPPPPDTDGDGILDATDGCVDQPETVNAWRDDDGCPDRLGTLRFVALGPSGPAEDAQIEVYSSAGVMSARGVGEVNLKDLVPGSGWKAEAVGRCLEGELTVTATDGDLRPVVQLTPKQDAQLAVKVVDGRGQPVPRATVTWGEATGPCASPLTELPTGDGVVPVGAGDYEVFVTADGYSTWESKVHLDRGQRLEVKAELRKSRVQLTETQVIILDKVYFETGKADIKPESFALLDEVAQTIRRAHLHRVEVAGHTDDVGSDSANLSLSQGRAEAVVAYLVRKGVDPARLVAVGYGETRPMEPKKTSAARAKNRRVEFNILQGAAPAP